MVFGVVGAFSPPGFFDFAFLFVDFAEHRPAPATARAGGETFGDLRRDNGFFDAAEIADLAQRDVETKADFVVIFQGHYGSIVSRRKGRGAEKRKIARSALEAGEAIIAFVVDAMIAALKGTAL